RAKRYHSDLCIVFFDLDDFKSINDTYGHDKGDQALIIIANIFENLRRGSDIIARYAGDEFVAILPSTKIKQAEEFVIRIKNELYKNPVESGKNSKIEDKNFHIYTSHGIASFFEDNCTTPSELLKRADTRLYKAKKVKNKKNKP
ncbi:MAG: GGDEF domain-containing protein, partial [Desulfobacteraceae bacterium]|nr:GGDEF domain-containing protein [Desulfobacteraceae bacterium]